MKINEKIYNLRKEHNLSQEELAEELGVSRQTISKWELGESNPDFDKIVPLCELFNISTEELLRDKKEVKVDEDKIDITKVVLISISIAFYFLGFIGTILAKKVWGYTDGIAAIVFLGFAAVGTVILLITLLTRRSKKSIIANYDYDENPIANLIIGIMAILFTIAYILLSIYTNKWHITWIIWLFYAIGVRVVKLIFELKKRNKKESNQ